MHSTANNRKNEWNSHIRGGMVALWLFDGHKFTTKEIMRRTGLSKQGVESMMATMSLAFPVVRINGKWQWKW